ncbi:Basic leucine zipper domain-containing protein [Entamoeba marina]
MSLDPYNPFNKHLPVDSSFSKRLIQVNGKPTLLDLTLPLLAKDQLIQMSLEEIDDYINAIKECRSLTPNETTIMKKARRRIVNRLSAKNWRIKSKDTELSMKEEVIILQNTIMNIKESNQKILQLLQSCEKCKENKYVQELLHDYIDHNN